MKVLSYILLFIFPVIIFVVALITFLFALNLPIDADGILGETTKSIQNMLSSLVRVLWAVAFMELCAAGFIAYVIYTLKLQEEK